VANSFGVFAPKNTVSFATSFVYWTDTVKQVSPSSNDPLPVLLTRDAQGHLKNTPAPWVPFTRAGCDVGAFSTANIEFEDSRTRLPSGATVLTDVLNVYGPGSPQVAETIDQQVADFEGVSVHCAKGSAVCSSKNGGVPDLLPDEPGGYAGYMALFGAKYVAPAVGMPKGVTDLDGNVIKNADSGLVGFTSFDPLATQSLGYVAAMQEAGIPVTFAYIADAHDDHANGVAFGPGQDGYVAQLRAYDRAFEQFFERLKKDGIDQSNTLFIFSPDEGDHFVGGPPSPARCDGVHTPCTYTNIGELDINLNGLVKAAGDATPFSIHFDSAPTVYINGDQPAVNFDPASPDALARGLEQTMSTLTAQNPITGRTDKLMAAMADPVGEKLLHMVTPDPARTPNFTFFGNPDYFFLSFGSTSPTEEAGFAWNHGDIQPEIAQTWFGLVGPGVRNLGETDSFFSDHTDLRPTILALVGLRDDYTHDGRVLVETLEKDALPDSLRVDQETLLRLARLYKQLNAPFGPLAMDSLKVSTRALSATDDETYTRLEQLIAGWTVERDAIVEPMKNMLAAAAFDGRAIDEAQAKALIEQGQDLLDRVHDFTNDLRQSNQSK
jgi:hypothetical protein